MERGKPILAQFSPTNAPSLTFARIDTYPDDDGVNILYTTDQGMFLLVKDEDYKMTVQGVATRLFHSTGLFDVLLAVNTRLEAAEADPRNRREHLKDGNKARRPRLFFQDLRGNGSESGALAGWMASTDGVDGNRLGGSEALGHSDYARW
ncbi:hypothetical protein CSOJ01_14817 [Colletotrichum sojae]|uniref:Uncharacterized protein n=1 Tax=Colletotrichum sojae TaxID=2175907 RepID=A0A8H6IPR9_9PEZI|nr:hypothetical protein CSOJ01_14817 [Colletotrichum sojae]